MPGFCLSGTAKFSKRCIGKVRILPLSGYTPLALTADDPLQLGLLRLPRLRPAHSGGAGRCRPDATGHRVIPPASVRADAGAGVQRDPGRGADPARVKRDGGRVAASGVGASTARCQMNHDGGGGHGNSVAGGRADGTNMTSGLGCTARNINPQNVNAPNPPLCGSAGVSACPPGSFGICSTEGCRLATAQTPASHERFSAHSSGGRRCWDP